MKLKSALCLLALLFMISCSENKQSSPWIISAPAGDRYVSIDASYETIIPNGRIVEYLSHTPYWKNMLIVITEDDAGATDLADFFTDTPNYRPYSAVPVDPRIFNPQKALDPFDENFDWEALDDSPVMDNNEDMIRESKEKDEYRLENREKEEL